MSEVAITERVVFGLLASAARLVPVPFLDDILREKATHLMVSRILKQHGRTYGSRKVQPLYSDNEGCLTGCFLFGLKLALFPVRKVLSWILAAKFLAQDLAKAVLLGRVLDRALASGRLSAGEPDALAREADHIRRAFDNAVAGTDMKLLSSVIRRALSQVSGLPRAALRTLRRLRKSDTPTEGLDAKSKAKVEEGASQIEKALEDPQMKAFLEAFDARFDDNMLILEDRSAKS